MRLRKYVCVGGGGGGGLQKTIVGTGLAGF